MLEEDIGKIIETTLADEANGRMKVISPIYVRFLFIWCTCFVLRLHMIASFFNAHDPDASITKHL